MSQTTKNQLKANEKPGAKAEMLLLKCLTFGAFQKNLSVFIDAFIYILIRNYSIVFIIIFAIRIIMVTTTLFPHCL